MTGLSGAVANLDDSYAAAVAMIRERAVSFYHAFSQLPPDRFHSIAALYAFCRTADDVADQDGDDSDTNNSLDRLARLDELEEKLVRTCSGANEPDGADTDRSFAGSLAAVPWWAALTDTIRRFDIPADSFVQQIQGQRMDLAFRDMATLPDLIEYCRLVAGSVGTMLMPVLAASGKDTRHAGWRRACEELGIGMQITNILRDVGEDLRQRNRVYLPADMLKAHGLSRDVLAALAAQSGQGPTAAVPEAFVSLWEELAAIAEPYYQSYETWLDWFHPAGRVPLVAAARTYRSIADAVRQSSYDCFTRRCYTSAATRDLILRESAAFVQSRPSRQLI